MRKLLLKIALCVALVACTVYVSMHLTDNVAAMPEPKQQATLMIDIRNGIHASIWKFTDSDNDKICYFNAAGGIWCDR